VGRVPAGASWGKPVPSGACVAIATGAPVPADLDTVVEHERSDRGSPVRFSSTVPRGASIHRRGADAALGAELLGRGDVLRPQGVGLAAAVGRSSLVVAARPTVAILTSGDEVVAPEAEVEPHQIRNSNGPMLEALVARFGGVVSRREHVLDDLDATVSALSRALDSADCVVTVGGISAGERDWMPDALERLGVVPMLRGAAIQPGGPIAVGAAPAERLWIGLPGNPVSVLACAHLFLWPAIRTMLGASRPLPWVESRLTDEARPNSRRRQFRPGRLRGDAVDVLAWGGSGDLAAAAAADALVELPSRPDAWPAGAAVRVLPLP